MPQDKYHGDVYGVRIKREVDVCHSLPLGRPIHAELLQKRKHYKEGKFSKLVLGRECLVLEHKLLD